MLPARSASTEAMRILHVVPSYYPALRYGGPIRSVHGLAKGLVRRGHEVHVFTTDLDGPTTSPVQLDEAVDLDGVTVRYFSTGLGRRLFRSPPMGRALFHNIRGFDVVHLHSVFLWPTSAAAFAARRVGVPYILAPRGMLVRELIARKNRVAKAVWMHVLERGNLSGASAIHVTSDVEAHDFAALGLRHKALVTIPNGIDVPCLPDGPHRLHPLLAEFLTLSCPRYILYLGRINWKKGLDRLISAMSDVSEATLVIAGNDEEGYEPVLHDLARQAGVAPRVRFVGPVHGAEKWELLAGAEMLVLPSYSENFGMVVLEAMMSRCPVVITPEVGLASAVCSAGAGVVVKGEPRELSRAINALLQAPDKCRRMAEAGRRLAIEKYSWDTIAADMERVYREHSGMRHAL